MAGIPFGSFIVPGLILMSVLTQAVICRALGFPSEFYGHLIKVSSAPSSPLETVAAYVGAAATKAVILALVTSATANLFVDVWVAHPLLMILFLIAISIGFCLLGFAIGIWAKNFEQLQVIPLLVVTPLTFLGGVFYSTTSIAEPWRTITHLNPILYLVSGYRWTFFGVSDVPLWSSVAVMAASIILPFAAIVWIFRTGYRLKS